MKLERIIIKNFRRIGDATIDLASSAFLIGPNNSGKSSILDAIDALLSLKSDKVTEEDFRMDLDGKREETIEITGIFSDISNEISNKRGFKGRVIDEKFTYKKTYKLNAASKPKYESIIYPYKIKDEFTGAKIIQDLINAGIDSDIIKEVLGNKKTSDKLTNGWEKDFIEVIEYQTDEQPVFEENPGGIPANVNSKLPKLIRIPSTINMNDIESSDKKYILGECLGILFEDLLEKDPLANEIQQKLTELEDHMKPLTDESMMKVLINEVNKLISSVFPNCGIDILPNLQKLSDIIKPKYEISIFSNIKTKSNKQGTGLLRTTIFSMLRYHSYLKKEMNIESRPIFVAFEEPEIYLHPSAANLLRDTIYSLGVTDQICCSTHSPWMIDLTKEPLSLTRMNLLCDDSINCINYGLTSTYLKLEEDDKSRIKMLQIFDDELSRVFFAEKVIIVEGDTELLLIRNTLKLLPEDLQKDILSKYQIVKARGKATIISLVKYLQDLSIHPIVMHDRDKGVEGAVKFNEPIKLAINDIGRLILNEEIIEDTLGYSAPSSDKPYKAFAFSYKWKSVADIPQTWREKIEFIFNINLNNLP
ncbi:MAG: AAA family ATPase [Candidatus Kapabacteria bacterium]|nr:AAA family ATPase [Candidatus Kapabacteria bacterium]